MTPIDAPPPARLSPGLRHALDLGPLALFFVANWRYGIFVATPVLMAGVVVALAVSWHLTRRVPIMPLVTALFVTVFGALTLWLHDAEFIKIKATIVYGLFGAALLGGLLFGKALLPIVLDSVIEIDAAGWNKLTLRWGLFFFALAALNEIVWRTQTTDFWAGFKVFGVVPLTFAFALAQVPLIMRHELKGKTDA